MTVFQLLGSLLLLLSGGTAAFASVRYEQIKISVLDGWIELILYIRSQIDCYLTPLNEILSGADRELLRACMCMKTPGSPEELLYASRFYLNPESRRLLTSFIRELGGSYREEQVKRCDYYMTSLQNIREKQMSELPAKQKVHVAICLCAAVGAVILLW